MPATIHWTLFHADPSAQPPFSIQLGIIDYNAKMEISIDNCAHIADAAEKIKKWRQENQAEFSSNFTLLYPIYLDMMGSDFEDTMHQVAWLIKDEADKNKWGFGRVNGLDGKTKDDFYIVDPSSASDLLGSRDKGI